RTRRVAAEGAASLHDDVREATVLGADAEQVALSLLELMVRVRHAHLIDLDAALLDEPLALAGRLHEARARERLRDPERGAIGRELQLGHVRGDRVLAVYLSELLLGVARRGRVVEACDELAREGRLDLARVAAL